MTALGDHVPVLLEETLAGLITDPGGRYIDGTFGRGGHTGALLARLAQTAEVMAIDRDPVAVAAALAMSRDDRRLTVEQGEFSALGSLAERRGWQGTVSGVLLDLGVSSPQLDTADRGFSFLADGPLDMRMNPGSGVSAAQWLAQAQQQEIADVLRDYGEERFARRMAGAIVRERAQHPITRTAQLARIISEANPAWEQGKHPATRAFQAIRIQVNDELGELKRGLVEALNCLSVGGRLAVISFHSLEDRIVKRFFRDQARGDHLPRSIPVMDSQLNRRLVIKGRAQKASRVEVETNPRARSAVLRVAEKIG